MLSSYITGNCSQTWKYYTFKMSKFPSFDHALDEKSFSISFCLPLNISRLINLQLKVSVSIFHIQAVIIQAGDELYNCRILQRRVIVML